MALNENGVEESRVDEGERTAAVVIEPSISFANELLEAVRDIRKRLGRDVRVVWMPPESCCATLVSAVLPGRARDEVIAMGLSAAVPMLKDFTIRLDPPSLERLGDGSMLILSRVWSEGDELAAVTQKLIKALDTVGVEARMETEAAGGVRFILGWIPAPCSLTEIPASDSNAAVRSPDGARKMPEGMVVRGLMAGIVSSVEGTHLCTCRRVRAVPFAENRQSRFG